MRKLVQINPVIRTTTSTGKIMQEIGAIAESCGWECHIAYSRGRDGVPRSNLRLLPIGSRLSVALHGLLTRLTDRHGLGSSAATRRFVRELERIDPDVIHIHNIHGYFLNYKILFEYLKRSGKPVVWTVHDCWLFTGHCYHYASSGCGKWKSGCGGCPQSRAFPASWFVDRSAKNYKDKKEAFTSLGERLSIVTVSKWMRGQMAGSFLKDCRFEVVHNGIDTGLFKPVDASSFIRKHSLGSRHILLGVASIWSREKGLDEFVSLSRRLNDNEVLLLVGLTEQQKDALPESIVKLPRTADVGELVEIYGAAGVFINLTLQENYPTVNLEAISCGTPVVTYDTGGCRETVSECTGTVVPQGDIDAVLKAARKWLDKDREECRRQCRTFAEANFSKGQRYREYVRLYEELAR